MGRRPTRHGAVFVPARERSRRALGLVAIAVIFVLVGSAAARLPVRASAVQDVPRGVIVDKVTCIGEPSQSYALYVPSTYVPERTWNLLIAFHPGARGHLMVETYAEAAERYGYIVAGSNNSRNGSWEISGAAVRAMSLDLGQRFSIDAERIYLTGMSGGARVAMQVALGKNRVAGVIASSAGFPDTRPRSSVPFAVFGTAGTEDFNYMEMRRLDRKLTSPHRLAVFEGGHTLPPRTVALEAIEWMEIQAMKAGLREPDATLVERLFDERAQQVAASASGTDALARLEALVADFTGLRDVSAEAARLKTMAARPELKKALARERADEDAEARMVAEILDLEAALIDEGRRGAALVRLERQLSTWSTAAAAPSDTPGRRQARRVLRAIAAGATERAPDEAYRALLAKYAPRNR